MIFNKQVTKYEFNRIKEKIQNNLGYWTRPEQLTKDQIKWLKDNIKQFNKEVLDKIIENSKTPDNPKSD